MAVTTVTTPTVYTTEDFDYSKALGGALCIITNQASEVTVPDNNSNVFKGAGIVRKDNPNRLVLVYKGDSYYFKENGDNVDGSSFNLKLATIEPPTAVGPAVEGINVTRYTRSSDGTINPTTGTVQNSVVVADLNPRDHFAIQALQSMMGKISDPSVLSNAEMDLYCKAAYLWASNMMKNAANARATVFVDNGAPSSSDATISSLDNNTERLLNNLIEELKKNDATITGGTADRITIPELNALISDLITAVEGISPGGGGADLSTLNKTVDQTTTGSEFFRFGLNSGVSGNPIYITLGAQGGLGQDAAHPFYISSSSSGSVVIETVGSFPTAANVQKEHYYRLTGTQSTVGINLPAVTDVAAAGIILFHFSCSANATFSVNVPSGTTVKYRGTNPGASLSEGTYEVDCLDNGLYWIVGVTEIVS